jgi:hypothetical protein
MPVFYSMRAAARQEACRAKMVRWHTPAKALKMATADDGELMSPSGSINACPGKLGVLIVAR